MLVGKSVKQIINTLSSDYRKNSNMSKLYEIHFQQSRCFFFLYPILGELLPGPVATDKHPEAKLPRLKFIMVSRYQFSLNRCDKSAIFTDIWHFFDIDTDIVTSSSKTFL